MLPPIETDSVKSLTDCFRAQNEKVSGRIVMTRYKDQFESMDEHEGSKRTQSSEEQTIPVLRSIRKLKKKAQQIDRQRGAGIDYEYTKT